MTRTLELEVPFADLMEVIEDYLVYSGHIDADKEVLAFADLGFSVTENDTVQIYAEVEDYDDGLEPADIYDLFGFTEEPKEASANV